MTPITNADISSLTSSRESCIAYLLAHRIRGWPKIVTPEPGKHFLVRPPVTFPRR